jgi:hypothetical protein
MLIERFILNLYLKIKFTQIRITGTEEIFPLNTVGQNRTFRKVGSGSAALLKKQKMVDFGEEKK